MPNTLISIFHSSGQPLELRSLPRPAPDVGEILLTAECVTLCRSDLSTFSGKRKEATPTILGHEGVGRIEAFGTHTSRSDLNGVPLQIGDRVTWSIFAADKAGKWALRGIPQKQPGCCKYGHRQLTDTDGFHGGLAQHILLRPHTGLIKLEEDIPPEVGSLINCAGATAAAAIRLAGSIAGKVVWVSGLGTLGLMAISMAKEAGAKQVLGLDISSARREKALEFGAEQTRDPEEIDSLTPPDLVIECSGAPSAMEQTLTRLNIGGTAIWIGAVHPQRPLHIDAEQVLRRLLHIHGQHNYNLEDFRKAADFITRLHQQYPFASLIQEVFSLKQVNDAFAFALESNAYRIAVKP